MLYLIRKRVSHNIRNISDYYINNIKEFCTNSAQLRLDTKA